MRGWSLSSWQFMGEREPDRKSEVCIPLHHGAHNPEKHASTQKGEKRTDGRYAAVEPKGLKKEQENGDKEEGIVKGNSDVLNLSLSWKI